MAALASSDAPSEGGRDMRLVIWTDRAGWRRASHIRDGDPDTAAERGVPVPMPDLGLLDCEEVRRDINNHLVDQRLFSWRDVQRQQTGVTNAVKSAIVRRVIQLYKEVNNG